MTKILELRGLESLYAAQAVHKLMYGIKMLPSYISESYEDFYARLDKMPPKDQESILREASVFVKLDPDETMDLLRFCADANGIPFGKQNIKNLRPEEIHEMLVAVSLQVLKDHKIRLVSETEKKN